MRKALLILLLILAMGGSAWLRRCHWPLDSTRMGSLIATRAFKSTSPPANGRRTHWPPTSFSARSSRARPAASWAAASASCIPACAATATCRCWSRSSTWFCSGTVHPGGALSIAAGGVRYDFALAAEETAAESRKCERFTLPLDEEMFRSWKALLRRAARSASMASPRCSAPASPKRTGIETASSGWKPCPWRRCGISSPCGRRATGCGTSTRPTGRTAGPRRRRWRWMPAPGQIRFPPWNPTPNAWTQRDRGAVRAYQQLLKEHAFFTGKVDAVFGQITREATRQVQQLYGLVPTGMRIAY